MNIIDSIIGHLPSKKGRQALFDLSEYLKLHGPVMVQVRYVKEDGGYYLAECSIGNRHIITTGQSEKEMDWNVKDAIFTAFEVPPRYCNFASLESVRDGKSALQYATT